jgi:thiamine biosynthesis lipoprotein
MGTEVEVLSEPALRDTDARAVCFWFDWVEARLSRFRPDSELSRLNAAAGRPVMASPVLREVLGVALAAAGATGGLVDPTVLGILEAAGYSVSIEAGPRVSRERTALPDHMAVRVLADGRVHLPQGMGIDLGGVAKGWTVDRSADLLKGYPSWLVNAGGDLYARGAGPSSEGWTVGVEDPYCPGTDALVLQVRDAAVATSSTMRRRWASADGAECHHLIDPRTGRPAETDLVSVTVLGCTVVDAEVEAKALLLLGSAGARRRAAWRDTAAVLIDERGDVTVLGDAGDYVVA